MTNTETIRAFIDAYLAQDRGTQVFFGGRVQPETAVPTGSVIVPR